MENQSSSEVAPTIQRGSRAARKHSAMKKQLSRSVCLLHEPEGMPKVEFVFVHGLQMHSARIGLFGRFAKSKTALIRRFPDARFYSLEYNASSAMRTRSDFFANLGESLLQEMVGYEAHGSTDVNQESVHAGIGQQTGCPVVFVCHDAGVLVAKQIVIHAHDKFQQDKTVQKLLNNVTGFFFYTPSHRVGSQVSPILDASIHVGFEVKTKDELVNKWQIWEFTDKHRKMVFRDFIPWWSVTPLAIDQNETHGHCLISLATLKHILSM